MWKIAIAACAVGALGPARVEAAPPRPFLAQRRLSQEKLRQRLAAKLAEPWVAAADWTTDYDVARARAKRSKKPIFAYFTRSYQP